VSFSSDLQGNHVIQHLLEGGSAQECGEVRQKPTSGKKQSQVSCSWSTAVGNASSPDYNLLAFQTICYVLVEGWDFEIVTSSP